MAAEKWYVKEYSETAEKWTRQKVAGRKTGPTEKLAYACGIIRAHGTRTIAENNGGLRGGFAAQGGRDYFGGTRDAEWRSCARARDESGCGIGCYLRRWRGDREAREVALFYAEQAEGVCDDGERSGGAAHGGADFGEERGESLSGGAAGLCERRITVDDE